ncbi:PAS domain S-box protein [Thermodesulfobacteriota bacterium]
MKNEEKTEEMLINEYLQAQIDELEMTEKELRESERKYRLVIENAAEAIFVIQDGMLKFSNPKTLELFGYSEDELTSRPIVEYVHPDDRKRVMKQYIKRLKGEENPHVPPFKIINQEGDIRWVEIQAALTSWERNPAILNFLNDITDRKRIEDALRESEAQKRAILDASIDRIRHVDKDFKIIWANRTTLYELDMPPEQAIGQTCHKLFVGKDTPCEGCPTALARETGKIERAIIHKPTVKGIAGESFWDTYCVPLKNKSGDIVSFIQIARNITEQKRAEDSLRDSEERFKRIFASSPIGLAIYDPDFGLLDANDAFLKIFGVPALSMKKGQHIFNEPFVSHEIKETLRAFEPVRYEFSIDFESIREQALFETDKTGIIYLDILITPLIRTAGASSPRYLVQVQDISTRKQAEAQIHNLTHAMIKAQEGERLRISRDLHDRIAQDLSILKITFDTLFDDHPNTSPELKEKVTRITSIIQGTISAVRDLAYELRPPGLDQLGLVRTIFQYCEDLSKKMGIKIDFYAAGMEELRLDFDTEINLYRIIQEGLNNVQKHADATRVTIRLVSSFPKIILRIEDDGKGFDLQKRLLTAIQNRRMGLQNIRERVALLNGKIKIKSRPMTGTKIFIDIPYQEKHHGHEETHFHH